HARGQDQRSRARRARTEQGAQRHGFAALDRADAGGNSGGDLRHRQRGGSQRGAVRRRDAGPGRCGHRKRPGRVPRTPDRGRDRRGRSAQVTTVGILGGGQLARMIALSGAPLGLRFLVMDSAADACAAQFVPMVLGDYRDQAALQEFASRIDVATFDFENVPAESARWLAGRVPVFPNPGALATAQDRLAEKTLFREHGIPVPEFAPIATRAELDAAVERIGVPCVLKTRRLGYDGKGQFRIRDSGLGTRDSESGVEAAWRALGGQAETVGLILEAFVPFERELSVVAVRGRDGEFRAWPVTENWHVDGVLSASLAPARVDEDLAATAIGYARKLAAAMDYVGVFALELFCKDGRLLANELAPRV